MAFGADRVCAYPSSGPGKTLEAPNEWAYSANRSRAERLSALHQDGGTKMPEELSHDEIAERFLRSESLNFEAMGRFVTEIGPELVVRDTGWHGVTFGRFNILACMWRWEDLQLVGSLRAARQAAAAIDGKADVGP